MFVLNGIIKLSSVYDSFEKIGLQQIALTFLCFLNRNLDVKIALFCVNKKKKVKPN